MVSETIYLEAELAANSFLLGVVLMAVYDALRLFRMMIPHGSLAIGLEDFGFWICCTMMTFRLLFLGNSGILRSYVIICVFAGMILYDRIVSQPVFGVLKKVKIWFTIKGRELTMKGGNRRQSEKVRNHGTEP